MMFFTEIIKIALFVLLSPLVIGVVRKVKAFMQSRQGASITQPYADLWKLFHKDEVIPTDASWVFTLVPFLLFGISMVLFAAVPVKLVGNGFHNFSDFILIVGLLGLSAFLLAIAGMDTGSAFGGFGSSREMTLAAITEGTLFFSLLPVALIARSTDLIRMGAVVSTVSVENYLPILIAFLGYFIAMMCETGRIPFDNAATHLELTMIHEAMILEYSGKRLALIEWASSNKFLFFVVLGCNIFFPWTPMIESSAILTGIISVVFLLLKSLILLLVIALIESSIAKLRLFRLPDLLLTGFIFGVIAIIVAGI